jgi:hypothetical protein
MNRGVIVHLFYRVLTGATLVAACIASLTVFWAARQLMLPVTCFGTCAATHGSGIVVANAMAGLFATAFGVVLGYIIAYTHEEENKRQLGLQWLAPAFTGAAVAVPILHVLVESFGWTSKGVGYFGPLPPYPQLAAWICAGSPGSGPPGSPTFALNPAARTRPATR